MFLAIATGVPINQKSFPRMPVLYCIVHIPFAGLPFSHKIIERASERTWGLGTNQPNQGFAAAIGMSVWL